MILDTSFLIDVLRGNEGVERQLTAANAGVAYVTPITIMELWEGVHRSSATQRERERVKEVLTGLDEVPFDRDCAVAAGRINASLGQAGEPVDDADVMIASCALVHDEPVVTRNISHFERIDDIEVISY